MTKGKVIRRKHWFSNYYPQKTERKFWCRKIDRTCIAVGYGKRSHVLSLRRINYR